MRAAWVEPSPFTIHHSPSSWFDMTSSDLTVFFMVNSWLCLFSTASPRLASPHWGWKWRFCSVDRGPLYYIQLSVRGALLASNTALNWTQNLLTESSTNKGFTRRATMTSEAWYKQSLIQAKLDIHTYWFQSNQSEAWNTYVHTDSMQVSYYER